MHDIRALKKAVELIGGQANMSRAIGVSQQRLSNWQRGINAMPPKYAVAIERAIDGKVTRHDLRPDLSAMFG